ncbi:MAG: hypothetical protein KC416_13690 [Myxococcales bacterium]|nr:hypothetical protein [Myxococcales bacterium]
MNLFVTVGNRTEPFDRLLRTVDEVFGTHPTTGTCQYGTSNVQPRGLEPHAFLSREDFLLRIQAADLVVAHAGVGTLAAAIEGGHLPLVMARRAPEECVNDHQQEIVRALEGRGLVRPIEGPRDLAAALGEASAGRYPRIAVQGRRSLGDLRSSIHGGQSKPWHPLGTSLLRALGRLAGSNQ